MSTCVKKCQRVSDMSKNEKSVSLNFRYVIKCKKMTKMFQRMSDVSVNIKMFNVKCV